ncbi:alpha/beta fold hydrolase [Tamlana flava]|uniref:alpha/beta fold hydrolase n=1 Tax=Tamlana flava TaxID=3158572 RepID=UPI00351BA871
MSFRKKVSQDLYPFKSRFVTINGHRLHYLDEGNGYPLLMLHGNPSWSFYYRELIKKLRTGYRCIAPDHIGMGLSDKPSDSQYTYTLEQRVKDLEEFLIMIGITENITMIVHDWGGIIGMSYARHHSKQIKRIVLSNTAAFHLPEGKKLPFMLRLARSFVGRIAVRGFNAFNVGSTRIGVKRIKMSRQVKAGYTAPYDSWKNRIGIMRFVEDIPLKRGDPGYDYIQDVQDHLHLFKKNPVLIVWGLRDLVFDIHFLNKWIEYLPSAQINRFEDCGHYILEDAQEEVGLLITDFLKNTDD